MKPPQRAGNARSANREIVQRATAIAGSVAMLFGLACPPELAAQRKPSPGPRAIGVMVFPKAAPGAKKAPNPYLIPIALWYQSRYFDAQLYGAKPQPFALEGGVVYEVRKGGEALGLFTIDSIAQADKTWLGGGQYRTMTQIEARAKARAARQAAPSDAVAGDGPPKMKRRGGVAGSAKPEPPPVPDIPSDKKDTTSSDKNKAPAPDVDDDDPDRPRLHRAPSSDAAPDAGVKPTDTPNAGKTPASKTQAAEASDDMEDPDRPKLHRAPAGEPQEVAPKINAKTTPIVTPSAKTPGATASAGKVQSMAPPPMPEVDVAVSDEKATEARSYTFEWSADEKERLTKSHTAMANAAIADWLDKRYHIKAEQPAAKPAAASRTRTRSTATHSPEPSAVASNSAPLDDFEIRALDVTTDNYPEVIVSGNRKVQVPGPDGGTDERTVYVTLATRVDLQAADRRDQVRTLLLSVTDDRHLDEIPKLRFIDVVDADGDGIGELLFRAVSSPVDDANPQAWGFQFFRVGPDKLDKLYDSQGRME